MRIYSMTATFGKLEHETLTLQPGLNIIQAPNEWGKSTWCAFLTAMLYGIDTSARSTKTSLADKEHYTPWSGSPMAGRIDLNWNGKDITIERSTKGRLIMGQFQAYETATGIPIPELTATNCGQVLLGVERSVFVRAGFIKFIDLPVTQDDFLRRRLNALVTTGDESGSGDKLAQALKDLKNKCRYNRSGLLPQAETQRGQLEDQLHELQELKLQSDKLHDRQLELETQLSLLENHKTALRYEAAVADAQKVDAALQAQADAQAVYDGLKESCDGLPSSGEAEHAVKTALELQQQQMSLLMEEQMLPPLPEQPEIPAYFANVEPDAALDAAKKDYEACCALENGKKKRNLWIGLLLCVALLAFAGCAVAHLVFQIGMPMLLIAAGAAATLIGIGIILFAVISTNRFRKAMDTLYFRYPGIPPVRWISEATAFRDKQQSYQKALAAVQGQRGDFDRRRAALEQEISDFSQGNSLTEALAQWQQISTAWNRLTDAARDLHHAQSHAAALQSMAKTAKAPTFPDTLTQSPSETDGLIQFATFELRQLQLKLGQYQGRMEALGSETKLREQLRTLNHRIHQLEETYVALELAQKALSAATDELQRRFAPRIASRAQALFSGLTGARYDRLRLGQDLSLQAGAQGEDVLRSVGWRSDGTTDQLYLALRLAVAEELTPEAPLILDDALVRFDDVRLKAAMEILKSEAETKQVLLFTCQSREKMYL